jgi:Bacterial tandem repeat domain 1
MKTLFGLLLLTACLSLTARTSAQQTEVKNKTAAEYQREFNRLVAQGFRPVRVYAKTLGVIDYQPGERPQLGYWGTFEKRPNTTPWAAYHGISPGDYQREFNKWTSQGYMPTDINVAAMDGRTSYCVIFDKIQNHPAWQARHNLNQTDFTNTNNQLIQQGFTRTISTFCNTPHGRVYAGLWVKR